MLPLVLVSALLAGVLAEPPVNRQYLPPSALSTQYGAPSRNSGFGSRSGLSTQYGAPLTSSRFGQNSGISTQYGAPQLSRNYNSGVSTEYGVSSMSNRFNSISSQYGAPSANTGLSTQYGAPSRSNTLGFGSGLSTQYGTPSTSNNLGYRSGLSTKYGAPSNNFGFKSGLSTQYGAPAGGYGYGRGGAQEDPLAEPANYEFNYSVQDNESGSDFGHEESRQDENAQGQYRVVLPDGRLQIVDYEADQEGFKPRIRYEETGRGGYGRGPANGNTGGPY